MDREQFAVASRLAERLCRLVSTRAVEVGFSDGLITAVIHQGDVTRAHVEFFDAPLNEDVPLRLRIASPCVGFSEAHSLLKQSITEALQGCTVRYGNVATLFSKGRLSEVRATETFRIEREIPLLGRIFWPPFDDPASGPGPRSSPGDGNGKNS